VPAHGPSPCQAPVAAARRPRDAGRVAGRRRPAAPVGHAGDAPAEDVPQHASGTRPDRLPVQRARLRSLVRSLMRTQLHHLVAGMAARRGDAPAVTVSERTVSYAELWSAVTGFAASLRRGGLARGERVAVYLDKRIETVTA